VVDVDEEVVVVDGVEQELGEQVGRIYIKDAITDATAHRARATMVVDGPICVRRD